MNKSDLVKAIIKESKEEISIAQATNIFEATFVVISKTVKKEDRLAIPQFGIFKKIKRAARKGRNPHTGEEIKIKASRNLVFKPSVNVKKMM